jgi:3-methyladenine DNA glycosylase Tag
MAEEPSPPKQVKVKSLNDNLEVMSKVVFQSGMYWKIIENKWPGIGEVLENFGVEKIAHCDERDIELPEPGRPWVNRRLIQL